MTHFKNILTLLLIASTCSLFTACEKEEILETLSESEAVEIITTSLQAETGGMTTQLTVTADQLMTAVASGAACDTLYQEAISREHEGNQLEASYASELFYEMTCNGLEIPQTAAVSVATTATYETPRIDSDDNSTFAGDAVGLQPSAATLSLTGSYAANGTQELSFREARSVTSTLSAELTGIEIDKLSLSIQAGSGSFSFTGSTSDTDFAYLGTIVFNGDQTATLTINGTVYEIDWN